MVSRTKLDYLQTSFQIPLYFFPNGRKSRFLYFFMQIGLNTQMIHVYVGFWDYKI